jgi:hypothetical protein
MESLDSLQAEKVRGTVIPVTDEIKKLKMTDGRPFAFVSRDAVVSCLIQHTKTNEQETREKTAESHHYHSITKTNDWRRKRREQRASFVFERVPHSCL